MKQLVKKIKLQSTITVLTGLHIGGSSDSVEIGGLDNIVIKLATRDNEPYIPGSSLKGKMRCLLEQTCGATEVGKSKEVNKLFGISENKKVGITENIPSHIIVRDAYLTAQSRDVLSKCENLDMPFTENKYENTIGRVNSVANPRQMERVPAGAEFDAEFIINVWDDDDEEELMKMFEEGISLLESDYLGGSGSRGYGKIVFSPFKRSDLSAENNWKA